MGSGGWAFVPDPLPPKLAYGPQLVQALSEADRALGELAGLGRTLPNPYLFTRPFLRREAVLSSRIEGTQASLVDLYAFEVEPLLFGEPARRDDVQEVQNYVRALEHGMERLEDLPISQRLFREMHAVLMEGVRGAQRDPGEFRRIQNWIGPPGAEVGRPPSCHYRPWRSRSFECVGAVHPRTAGLAAPRGHRPRPLPVRDHPPVPRRQRPHRTAAHHAHAHRARPAPRATPLPERLLRAPPRCLLRSPARRKPEGGLGGLATLLFQGRSHGVPRRLPAGQAGSSSCARPTGNACRGRVPGPTCSRPWTTSSPVP